MMDDALINEFIEESREHLLNIEADLLTIEERGADIDEELVNKVFRAAHSIKGGSGFFGLDKVKEVAHKAETILDMIRSRQMTPNAEVTNVLLTAFDKLREMINAPAESVHADIADLVISLNSLASAYLPQEQKASLEQEVVIQPDEDVPSVTVPMVDFERARRSGLNIYRVEYDLIHDIELQGKNVLDVFRDLMETGEILDCSIDFDAVGTLDSPIGNQLPLRLIFATIIQPGDIDILFPMDRERIVLLYDASTEPRAGTPEPQDAISPEPPLATLRKPELSIDETPQRPLEADDISAPAVSPMQRSGTSKAPSTPHEMQGEDTLRVNMRLLETLMNLAGELVLSRNQLRAAIAQRNAQALSIADQRVNQVTSELQDAIMQTRLQPIGNVFARFPRLVRDLSNKLGKEIRLDMRGKDVALDKNLIEALSDPLTHMVRNSVDHGIEMPDQRLAAGKHSVGTIRIEARHEAGQVVVEISDDGKGIDPQVIARSALRKGLISEDKVRAMSDQDKVALIFLPGLSTSERVSDISGRGVGMDVVKTNLDRIGGKVEIKSEPGKGTVFSIKLPLTLAIMPSLIISVEDERFAIPQINIEELLRIRAEEVKDRIEVVGDAEVLLLRKRLIPLLHLGDLLGLTPTYINPETGLREVDRRKRLADRRSPRHSLSGKEGFSDEGSRAHPIAEKRRVSRGRRRSAASDLEIAVVNTGTMTYGLVVGGFHDTEEIVVKPLGQHLRGLIEYAGATILGDGAVVLILDIAGVAIRGELSPVSGSHRARELNEEIEREKLQGTLSLLTFQNAPGEWCATPMEIVQRIEAIAFSQVEHVGGRRTMQYRGASLPLVTLSDVGSAKPLEPEADLAVIVTSVHGREVGLMGAMPVDVVETGVIIDQKTHRRKGISGSAIINDRTTLIVDANELVDEVYPEWREEAAAAGPAAAGQGKVSVLLAEDSDFFRSRVKAFLEEDGYHVIDAPDGEAAWEALKSHVKDIRVVVTDVEMPRLTGLELASRIREDPTTAHLPVIALTSLASDEDMQKGKAAGMDDYQIKLDRDRLLESVRRFLSRSGEKSR